MIIFSLTLRRASKGGPKATYSYPLDPEMNYVDIVYMMLTVEVNKFE